VFGRTGNYIGEIYLFLGLLTILPQLFMLDMCSDFMDMKYELGSAWKQRIIALILSIDKVRGDISSRLKHSDRY
jgi:hypothetical protein